MKMRKGNDRPNSKGTAKVIVNEDLKVPCFGSSWPYFARVWSSSRKAPMPMRCPLCRRLQDRAEWTKAQWRQQSPAIGGRNHCKACHQDGPSQEDWCEVRTQLEYVRSLQDYHERTGFYWSAYLADFLRTISCSRKAWSHKGVLKVRCETDYITQQLSLIHI